MSDVGGERRELVTAAVGLSHLQLAPRFQVTDPARAWDPPKLLFIIITDPSAAWFSFDKPKLSRCML